MNSFSYHHCDDDDDDDAADDDDDDDDDAADDDDDYDNDDVDDDNEEDWSQVNTMIVHGGNNEGHNESFHQEVKPSKPPLTLPGRQVFLSSFIIKESRAAYNNHDLIKENNARPLSQKRH